MTAALIRIDGFLSRIADGRIAAMGVIALFALVLFLPGFFTLPPVDRDEARFAQASRQMVETGDLIDIRLGEEPRYKKPIGIYWLQSAAAWITGAPQEIWSYRLPSLISAVAAAVLTYLVALSLMGARVAFMAGLMMAGTMTLGFEARLAKTDAALLVTILLAMWPLARLFTMGVVRRPWLFWTALGASMLIKGPIGLMVVGLTIAGLCLSRRGVRWLSPLHPKRGVLIFAAIVLPWYVAITFVSGWAFWEEALINDLLAKVGEGQESHGAPPGSYLLAMWITFWPAAIFLPLGLWHAWQARAEPAVIFCVAWIVPSWIVFELTATKLPHYVLPTYPALAILCAAGWLGFGRAPGRALCVGMAVIMGLAAVLLVAAPLVFTLGLGAWPGVWWLLGLLVMAAGLVLNWRAIRQGLALAAIAATGVLSLGAGVAVFSSLSGFAPMWPSNALVAMTSAASCPAPRLISARYHEPSLLFLAPTMPDFTSAEGAAESAEAAGCAIVYVDTRQEAAFLAALAPETAPVEIGLFDGFTLGRSEELQIRAWEVHASQ